MDAKEYEAREIAQFQKDLENIGKLPLDERKENAEEWREALRHIGKESDHYQGIVSERIEWLLNGSYGYGPMVKALEVAKNKRMNRAAWLSQTIAALEWHVTPELARKAWKSIHVINQRAVNIGILYAVDKYITELEEQAK
jgi:hypothetical protein